MSLLSKIERQDILERFRHAVLAREKMRLHILLLLDDDYDYDEISALYYISDSTVRAYEKRYLFGKVEAVLKFDCKGSQSKMSSEETEALRQHLQGKIYLCSAAICDYIKTKYGISYSTNALSKILKKMGFVYKKPKLIPGKADVAVQKKFLAEELKPLLDKADSKNLVWFTDAMHPLHNARPAYGWIEKGVDKTLKSNAGRDRLNINGAYSLGDQKLVFREDERINAVSMVALLEQVKQASGDADTITLPMDNARYNHAKIVKEKAEELGITLLYLPPYSPNLNLIERLWRLYNKKVRNNKYYEKFVEFREKTLFFLENLSEYSQELQTLMTPKFQFLP